MLKHLHISQFALIDELDLDFSSGFTVITGETGAGKSIIMGALALVMGARSDTKTIRLGAQKCVVEATFDVTKVNNIKSIFDSLELDYDDDCVLRREVAVSGKSRSFINDTPVNQQQLRTISSLLIDIHSQHENLLLNSSGFQMSVVDAIAKDENELAQYKNIYDQYNTQYNKLVELKQTAEKCQADKDYAQFQFDQLEDAALQAGEQKELEDELEKLSHAEEIKTELTNMMNRMDDEQYGALVQMKDALQGISKVSKYLKEAQIIEERFNSLYLELKDVNSEVTSLCGDMDFDPQRKNWVEERLNVIYSLEQKHRVDSIEKLLDIKKEFEEKLLRINSFDSEIEELQNSVNILYDQLNNRAIDLSKKRNNVKTKISEYLVEKLLYLGMENAKVEVVLDRNKDFTPNGMDIVEFLFTANKNTPLRPISSIASGGEMARVMLALKRLIVKSSALSTIIFDEIDTGVSGEVAGRMGEMMSEMSKDVQVIAITHLPQIAAKGNDHFKVYKEDDKDTTRTHISSLNQSERELEIAEMLSGKNPSNTAISTARELMDLN